MKKVVLLAAAAALVTLASCGGNGVCTCTDGDLTTKTYYEDLSAAEKKSNKLACNGEKKLTITKLEMTSDGNTVTVEGSDLDEMNEQTEGCEWSKE